MDLTELIKRHKAGESFKYIPFWGGEMSQWHKDGFSIRGEYYETAEHYMMAEKARLFNDLTSLDLIMSTKDPSTAKKIGRKVKGFNDEEWDKVKYPVVVLANICKFLQNPELGDFLRDTGDAVLVEASPYDTVWGIGMPETDADCLDPTLWKGENLLGFAIMDARSILFP